MSILDYVQSLWGPSTPSTTATGGSAGTIAGLFSSSAPAHSGASAQQLGSGVWPLSAQVREEMKRGTRYNMKVILRGTKGTGKSTLLARLTAHPLPPAYTPSTELVASTMRLQGEHSAPNEGVKVDIWEVVEEGRQRSASSSSPNAAARNVPSVQLQEALRVAADARLLDVYANAHLTIFMIDPRQRASWEYAKQETLHVPPTCCVLYALNFADITAAPLDQAPVPVAVTLEELQAWCARSRRATTGLVHRMLEGRQAAPDFSVRPMTAVLSALSGSGLMGVIRALHVASTLLRIATEEVRVLRLFDLVVRQQAVVVRENDTPSPTPVTPPPPPVAASSGGERSQHASQQPPASTPAAAAAAALRTEHRVSNSAAASRPVQASAGVHAGGAAAAARGLSEADAMRLFLGSNSSGSSGSSRSSSSAASDTQPAHHARPALKPRHGPPGKRAAEQRGGVANTVAAAVAVQREGAEGDEAAVVPPVSDAAALPSAVEGSATAASPAVCAAEEEAVVRVLATTMVHDAAAPDDDFFGGEGGQAETVPPGATVGLEDAAADDAPAAPLVSATEESAASARAAVVDEAPLATERKSGMRARPLCTQRVVRTASASSTAAAEKAPSAPPALQVEVSAILAQMTAALAAGVPTATDTEAGAAVEEPPAAVTARKESGGGGERTSKKLSSKSHRHSKESSSSRHGHSRHRKHHREHRREDSTHEDGGAAAAGEEDDGSFELVVT